MAANVRTDMRIPTRAAPRPPNHPVTNQRNGTWSSSNDLFGVSFTQHTMQKKKPPPRPPPPKFIPKSDQKEEKPKKPARPTELLTNFFAKKGLKQQQQPVKNRIIPNSSSRVLNSTFQVPMPLKEGQPVCLIDLSPPGSPTFTTRSSSDGVSVDSFGSDGNSNPSLFTSSGSTSQTESAFEDDFDFFGNLSTNRNPPQNDPWKVNTLQQIDPFGPLPTTNGVEDIKEVGQTSFFAFNDNTNFPKVPTNKPAFSMPTIIRPKPRKETVKVADNIFSSKTTTKNYSKSTRLYETNVDITNQWDDSPPMPALPPPPPPAEYIASLEDGLSTNRDHPHGVALFDFPATHPGDLELKEGDMVYLTKAVNDKWMEGRVGNREGIFPINFIDIKVPLPGLPTNVVNAVYAFKGELSEDLSFEEGARITVLSKISDDWLYGECNGLKGQFPANYVDRVPSDLLEKL